MDSFSNNASNQHREFLEVFEAYRDQLTDVLFYGKKISRSDLTEGKNRVLDNLQDHIETVQQVVLPAVTGSADDGPVNGLELFADVQDRLLTVTEQTEDNVNFFANPDAPKEERNDAARETLKDIHRLDSLLSLYLELFEEHLLEPAERELDGDEKKSVLAPLGYAIE